MKDTIVLFFQDGGAWMWPILAVFALGLAIVVERFVFLSMAKSSNRKAFDAMLPYIKKGQFDALVKMADTSAAPVCRMIGAGAARYTLTQDRDDASIAMEEGLMEATPRLEKRTQYVATFANIATLLGLLGTIMGLVEAFSAVANAEPSEKASMLSAAISTAMNTTAFGLIAAMPLLLAHTFLQAKTVEIVDSLEMASVKFINMIAR
jgi:biopolymer transport protein ExbB/TolQ